MIDKEVAELRRRFRQERGNISRVLGCYVNTNKEIITGFEQSLSLLPLDEQTKYLDLLRKAMSGSIGKTLTDINFQTSQVVGSEEHRLLTRLRNSALSDEEAVNELYSKIASALDMDTNYLILLAYDCYDVPYRSSDGQLQQDAGDSQHRYIVCSVCPVKETGSVLHYDSAEKSFRDRGVDWVVAAPELGFAFPAFDDRATNIYGALYYNRSAAKSYPAFADAIFKTQAPKAIVEQREYFRQLLAESLEDECSAEVVQSVSSQLHELAREHKEAKIREPLALSGRDVSGILQDSGVSEEHLELFEEKYEETFGSDAAVSPLRLMNYRSLEYRMPDVVVKLNPDRQDLVSTRVIDGIRYLLIKAEEGLEINGVNVCIEDSEEK